VGLQKPSFKSPSQSDTISIAAARIPTLTPVVNTVWTYITGKEWKRGPRLRRDTCTSEYDPRLTCVRSQFNPIQHARSRSQVTSPDSFLSILMNPIYINPCLCPEGPYLWPSNRHTSSPRLHRQKPTHSTSPSHIPVPRNSPARPVSVTQPAANHTRPDPGFVSSAVLLAGSVSAENKDGK
jgi:hypothetical protein